MDDHRLDRALRYLRGKPELIEKMVRPLGESLDGHVEFTFEHYVDTELITKALRV